MLQQEVARMPWDKNVLCFRRILYNEISSQIICSGM
jgi:hypothetical protein